jgi:hypothetical protein
VATFLQLYGTKLDREIGSTDRAQLFTTVLRKEYTNEGQQKFNEQTGCFVKRDEIALTDGDGEYDLEAEATDYLWPAKVGASIKKTVTATSVVSYIEGTSFTYITEEELNVEHPGWRSHDPGVPMYWGFRGDTGSLNLFLYPAPDIPSTETWLLLWPYVAQPEDMTSDTHEPYGNATPRVTLRPYHDAILYYAAGLCELLRKNKDAYEWQMKRFSALVAKYRADQAPKRGTSMRLAYRHLGAMRTERPPDPRRYP